MTQSDQETVVRYRAGQRINHWITATCFVLLMLSGLAMYHPVFFWLSALFGGGQWTRAFHPWLGVVLVVSYAGMMTQLWRDNLWNADDTAWLGKARDVLTNDEEALPEVGRFNAGQKIVFWGMGLLIALLLVTGLLIWEVYFSTVSSIPVQRFALLLHSLAAMAAILIWIIHVYAGFWIRGSVRAMTLGLVTPGWAWRHHRKWMRGLAQAAAPKPGPGNAPGDVL